MNRWIAVFFGVAVAVAVVAAVVLLMNSGDRFGNPARRAAIESSTDCHELRRIAHQAQADAMENRSDAEFDQAIGYSNSANDRMEELGC